MAIIFSDCQLQQLVNKFIMIAETDQFINLKREIFYKNRSYGSYSIFRDYDNSMLPSSTVVRNLLNYYSSNDDNSFRTDDDILALVDNIHEVKFSKNRTRIPAYAFFMCNKLVDIVEFNNCNITSIDDYAFNFCTELFSNRANFASMPQNIETIGKYAFANCFSIKSIYIQKSIKSIGTGCFNNCINLECIYFPGKTKEQVEQIDGFYNMIEYQDYDHYKSHIVKIQTDNETFDYPYTNTNDLVSAQAIDILTPYSANEVNEKELTASLTILFKNILNNNLVSSKKLGIFNAEGETINGLTTTQRQEIGAATYSILKCTSDKDIIRYITSYILASLNAKADTLDKCITIASNMISTSTDLIIETGFSDINNYKYIPGAESTTALILAYNVILDYVKMHNLDINDIPNNFI